MRNIYQACKINEIQQGTIINGCIAEKYSQKKVFGIIITPRCDIENKKVPTFHYLPVVSFGDWIKEDFKEIFYSRVQKAVHGSIKTQCKSFDLSEPIIDTLSQEQVIEIVNSSSQIKTKQKISLASTVKDYGNILNKNNITELYKKYNSVGKQIISDLHGNNIGNFYILESWDASDTKCDYMIVLLRDVRRITFSIGEKVAKRIRERRFS